MIIEFHYIRLVQALLFRYLLIFPSHTGDPDETDIDDVCESDIDGEAIRGETIELTRPGSTLVTDIDAVRDLKNLPPPLVPGVVHSPLTSSPSHVQVPVSEVCFFKSSWGLHMNILVLWVWFTQDYLYNIINLE